LVHDAARPCIHQDDLEQLITTLAKDSVGGLLAVPLHDTIKQADDQGCVLTTLPRERLWRAFTPQMFRLGNLVSALTQALTKGLLVTDDASAMELAGYAPRLLEGRSDNIKITRPEDLALAEFYLSRQLLA
jgi:2-C-methyl-D-erythritol 4-phosphate cytidylyltransferase